MGEPASQAYLEPMSRPTGKKSRIASIEWMRTIAAFEVVLTHSNWGNLAHQAGGVWWIVYVLEKQASPLVIAFFGLSAGYFFGNRIRTEINPGHVFSVYAKRVFSMYAFWSLVYLLLPSNPMDILRTGWLPIIASKFSALVTHPAGLISGGKFHLWFFSSMLMGLALVRLFLSRSQAILFAVSVMFYGLFLLARSYSFLPARLGISTAFYQPVSMLFYVPVFFSAGWLLSSGKFSVKSSLAVSMMGVGFGVYVIEYYVLKKVLLVNLNPLYHIQLIGTLIAGIGFFLFLLSAKSRSQSSSFSRIGRYTLGVYACHMVFMDLFVPLKERFHSMPVEIACAVLVWALSLGTTIACSKNRFLKRFFV
jgi:surface polysaccharide O-acyltransferase-like enzyme